ncbi:hypothetical protein AX15_006382 [Amanita polypyramis BW_CC]|nr:hypothetical protein AX15_006382 [Amanita polypyramis BW_CC]
MDTTASNGSDPAAMLRRRSSSPSLPLLASAKADSQHVHFLMPDDSTDPINLSRDSDVRPRPLVHYIDEPIENKPTRPVYAKTESFDMLSSRASSGTDDDSTDYDWSGEDDLVDEEARYEKKMGIKDQGQHRWGVGRAIAILFSSLIGSTFLAALLVTPGILVQFLWYEPHKTEHREYVKDNVQSWLFWLATNLVISWYLGVLVDIVPTIVRYSLSAFWGHVSESVKSRIELYIGVKNTLKPVLYAASAWVSWTIIFVDIYGLYDATEPRASRALYLHHISQVIQFLFFFALVICVQRMLLHAIAIAFHRTAYKERVTSVKETLVVIERLRQYRPKPSTPRKPGSRTPTFGNPTPMSEKEHYSFLHNALRNVMVSEGRRRHTSTTEDAFEGDIEEKESALESAKHKGKARMSGSHISGTSSPERASPYSEHATPPLSAQHHYPPSPTVEESSGDGSPTIVHAARALKHVVLHDARNLRRARSDAGALSWNVTSAREAKRLARVIYTRLKQRHRRDLLPSDFYPAFPDHASAEAAFRVFDKDNNGDISRAEMKTMIMKVYKERRVLARSMRDVGIALKTLNRIILFFALVILFFISLSVFGVNVSKSLTSIYSLFIAASFIFKRASSSAFDSIMFLFVTHPFDTGDRCLVDTENLVVKKVGLFATVFTRGDGSETYYFNSQLFTKFITNYRRSDKTYENLTMHVAWRTPLEKLDELERCLNDWLSTEENRWYQPSTNITLQHIVNQMYLEVTIPIGHNGNWQDWGLRLERKTAFHAAVQYYCRQLGIIGYEAPIPIVFGKSPEQQDDLPPSSVMSSADDISVAASEMNRELADELAEREEDELKSTLGFTPPASSRKARLKARKSKSRKTAFRAAI